MPDPVRVGVSAVRREIYRASAFASGGGLPSTELLGTLFHRVFRSLMQPGSELAWTTVLDPESLGDSRRLLDHAWAGIVGPSLRANQAALQDSSRQVLAMWDAAWHLCKYVCQLLKNSFEQKILEFDAATQQWTGVDNFSVEEQLEWLVEDKGWTAPVLVSGVADGVWRNPKSRRWCAVELKLGSGSEAADLAQLCLYLEMIRAGSDGGGHGEISLFHFQPELKRRTLSEEEIEPVKTALRALIGRVAGVCGNGVARPSPIIEHRELGARLVQVLEQFGPMVTLDSDPIAGPSFLRFRITPGPGVKVRKILPLGEDLAVQLRLSRPALIRLDGGALVVELQRPDRQKLFLGDFRDALPGGEHGNAKILVGIDLERQPRFADLRSDCPHILVAGTTGSGKSEWLRMAIASLAATNTPETLRLMLIDPKRVTFDQWRRSPFLLDGPGLLFTPEEAIAGLHRLIEIMEERYIRFSRFGATDLDGLREKSGETPARIVCFCDEYGNLVAAKKNREAIELAINQLGAKARAAGIHLVLATQDPRAQILSPALKSNLPGRVCLRTTSAVQSRMMLEDSGAETLLGNGDLLFKTVGDAVRLQAPLAEPRESGASG